eukprot:scaffold587_cov339-Pavlova_lutheri.AAC.30
MKRRSFGIESMRRRWSRSKCALFPPSASPGSQLRPSHHKASDVVLREVSNGWTPARHPSPASIPPRHVALPHHMCRSDQAGAETFPPSGFESSEVSCGVPACLVWDCCLRDPLMVFGRSLLVRVSIGEPDARKRAVNRGPSLRVLSNPARSIGKWKPDGKGWMEPEDRSLRVPSNPARSIGKWKPDGKGWMEPEDRPLSPIHTRPDPLPRSVSIEA